MKGIKEIRGLTYENIHSYIQQNYQRGAGKTSVVEQALVLYDEVINRVRDICYRIDNRKDELDFFSRVVPIKNMRSGREYSLTYGNNSYGYFRFMGTEEVSRLWFLANFVKVGTQYTEDSVGMALLVTVVLDFCYFFNKMYSALLKTIRADMNENKGKCINKAIDYFSMYLKEDRRPFGGTMRVLRGDYPEQDILQASMVVLKDIKWCGEKEISIENNEVLQQFDKLFKCEGLSYDKAVSILLEKYSVGAVSKSVIRSLEEVFWEDE